MLIDYLFDAAVTNHICIRAIKSSDEIECCYWYNFFKCNVRDVCNQRSEYRNSDDEREGRGRTGDGRSEAKGRRDLAVLLFLHPHFISVLSSRFFYEF